MEQALAESSRENVGRSALATACYIFALYYFDSADARIACCPPPTCLQGFVLASHWGPVAALRPPYMLALPHTPWLGCRLLIYYMPWPRLVKPTVSPTRQNTHNKLVSYYIYEHLIFLTSILYLTGLHKFYCHSSVLFRA